MKKLKQRLLITFIAHAQAKQSYPLKSIDYVKDVVQLLLGLIFTVIISIMAIAHTIAILPIILSIIYLLINIYLINYFYKLKDDVFLALQKEPSIEDFVNGLEDFLKELDNNKTE